MLSMAKNVHKYFCFSLFFPHLLLTLTLSILQNMSDYMILTCLKLRNNQTSVYVYIKKCLCVSLREQFFFPPCVINYIKTAFQFLQ